MKNWIVLFSFFFIACGQKTTNKDNNFQLKVGDFLFQDLDSSPLCDAIELVTPGYKNGNFSHIGIIIELGDPYCINPKYIYKDNIRVLEAIPNNVTTTRLDSFLNRSFDNKNNPKVIVGRIKKQYQYDINSAISFLKNKIGEKYDNAFLINNNMYYCSELIYEAFLHDSVFKLRPMTFLDPKTQDTLETWKKYYSELEIEIPQNKLGINPGIMSLSDKIEIVHIYGIPQGMEK